MPPMPLPIEIAGYAPDLPDFNNRASPNARNVLPRTSRSFGPIGAPMVYASSALSARCQGAAAYLDSGGNVFQFAGDVHDLYQFASSSWNKVSKSAGAYAVPASGQWKFEYFNGMVLATDFSDNIQVFTLGSSTTFGDLAGSPPRARYMAAIRGFLALANTFDGVSGNAPQRVWWSAVGNPTNWPTPGTVAAAQVMSSYNDLTGSGGWNQGIVGNLGNADGAVFQEHAVFRMMFAGPPNVFDFLPAEGVKGCPAPGSIVQVGALVYYLGEDGFYAFDGATSTPIGADLVDKSFYQDVDQNNLARVCAAVDPINKIIFWAYPGKGNSNGNPNHVLAYRWDLRRWSIIDLTLEHMVRLLTVGYTLDQLYTVLGYTLDNLPAPLDSRVWTGGLVLLGLFDTSHRLNYLTGSNLAATVDTGEQQLFPGKRALISGARPWVDGGVPSIAIGKRDRLTDAVTFTAAAPMNAFGICPLRTTGRYTRARITLPAGAAWGNLLGLELDAQPRGER